MKTRKREKGIWVLKQSIIKNTMEPQQHLKCHIAKHTNYIYNIMTTSKSNGLMDGGVIWYNQAHVTYNYVYLGELMWSFTNNTSHSITFNYQTKARGVGPAACTPVLSTQIQNETPTVQVQLQEWRALHFVFRLFHHSYSGYRYVCVIN